MQSDKLNSQNKRTPRITGCVTACLLSGMLMLSACDKKKEAVAPPPPTVEVIAVAQKDVPIYQEWVGSLDGSVNAVIKPQVSGYLIKQNYQEGQLVKKGQALFEIDPRTFQATVDQAKGSLDQAKSDLARQEANYTTAKADLARIKPLAARNAVSQKDLDDAIGKELAGRSAVDAARAAIATAQANLDKAKLELGFTKITSPVDGVAGIAMTQLGNLVSPNSQQELTTVSNLNPIKAYINVSEQEYLKTKNSSQHVDKIELQLVLTDGSVYPHKGKFALADRQIDPATGTLKIGSLFPNPNNILRPGQYGKIRALMEVRKGALLIPQRSVAEMQGKYLVAVVGSDNKVDIRPVKATVRIGSDWMIEAGLKAGEMVIAEGTQKVRPEAIVNPKPYTPGGAPTADASAKPAVKPAADAAGKR